MSILGVGVEWVGDDRDVFQGRLGQSQERPSAGHFMTFAFGFGLDPEQLTPSRREILICALKSLEKH